MVELPKEYHKLKRKAEVNMEFLQQLMNSFKDIKDGNVRRVR